MKTIFLLRHAKSSWDDPSLDDLARPLNKRGRRAAAMMGEYFLRQGFNPSVVLCSPAARTRQTLDVLLPAMPDPEVRIDERIYDAAMKTLLARLQELPETCASVLLVGHNPGLERLALTLADGSGNAEAAARLEAKYPTGALTVLSSASVCWETLAAGGCRLENFVCPADLE